MNWKPIPSTRGCYSASSDGKIRRDKAVKGNCNINLEIKPRMNRCGYLRVNLSCGGKVRTASVHGLVAEAWLPRPNDCDQVNHIDGDKLNNNAWNLEWCNNLHNRRHAFSTGLQVNHPGERANGAKLTNEIVSLIRAERGITTQSSLASRFGVSQVLISRIQLRKSWKHI